MVREGPGAAAAGQGIRRSPKPAVTDSDKTAGGGCASLSRMSTTPTDTHVHHAIDYVEIPVTDLAAAKAFYAAAFGWTAVDYGPEYAGIQVGGREVGGLRPERAVRPGGPLVILYSEDLEGSVDAVTAAGGAIVAPIAPFPGGRRFHFADPAGNELAVWSDRD
jgi:predicted enzyme related to lactoylglutathione lyase